MRQHRLLTLCTVGLLASPLSAQEVAGLRFDVTVTTADLTGGTETQTGTGWLRGRAGRVDLRGAMSADTNVAPVRGDSTSILVRECGDSTVLAVVDHHSKTIIYPARMLADLGGLMDLLDEPPRMSFSVTNVVLDSLGAGETISGFATKRYRLTADVTMSMELLGETHDQSMRIDTEADYAEELSEFSDPLGGTRGYGALAKAFPWVDSAGSAGIEKLVRLTPRGLALRQVDRMSGNIHGKGIVESTTTVLSNVRRATFSADVFDAPAGYTDAALAPGSPPN